MRTDPTMPKQLHQAEQDEHVPAERAQAPPSACHPKKHTHLPQLTRASPRCQTQSRNQSIKHGVTVARVTYRAHSSEPPMVVKSYLVCTFMAGPAAATTRQGINTTPVNQHNPPPAQPAWRLLHRNCVSRQRETTGREKVHGPAHSHAAQGQKQQHHHREGAVVV